MRFPMWIAAWTMVGTSVPFVPLFSYLWMVVGHACWPVEEDTGFDTASKTEWCRPGVLRPPGMDDGKPPGTICQVWLIVAKDEERQKIGGSEVSCGLALEVCGVCMGNQQF